VKGLSFKTKVQAFTDFEGIHYLEVSKANVKKLGGKFLVRLVCTINGRLKYQCALQGLGGGAGWISLSQARMKKLDLTSGSFVAVKLTADKSRYGLPVPEELKELLRQDQEGKRRFDKLTPGKQRNILHYVGGPKDIDRRLNRALVVIENLKRLEDGQETTQRIFGSKSNFNRQS